MVIIFFDMHHRHHHHRPYHKRIKHHHIVKALLSYDNPYIYLPKVNRVKAPINKPVPKPDPVIPHAKDGNPAKLAAWIKPEHRSAAHLTFLQYEQSPKEFAGWFLKIDRTRFSIYEDKEKNLLICLRGTHFGGDDYKKDLFDDAIIAANIDYELSLFSEVNDVMTSVIIPQGYRASQLLFTGHSLGGFVALQLATAYTARCAVFNAAAPPTKDFGAIGPGRLLATAYHIVGDGISSHINDENIEVIRAYQGYGFVQTISAHKTSNFYEGKEVYGFWTAGDENILWKMFMYTLKLTIPELPIKDIPGDISDISVPQFEIIVKGEKVVLTAIKYKNMLTYIMQKGNEIKLITSGKKVVASETLYDIVTGATEHRFDFIVEGFIPKAEAEAFSELAGLYAEGEHAYINEMFREVEGEVIELTDFSRMRTLIERQEGRAVLYPPRPVSLSTAVELDEVAQQGEVSRIATKKLFKQRNLNYRYPRNGITLEEDIDTVSELLRRVDYLSNEEMAETTASRFLNFKNSINGSIIGAYEKFAGFWGELRNIRELQKFFKGIELLLTPIKWIAVGILTAFQMVAKVLGWLGAAAQYLKKGVTKTIQAGVKIAGRLGVAVSEVIVKQLSKTVVGTRVLRALALAGEIGSQFIEAATVFLANPIVGVAIAAADIGFWVYTIYESRHEIIEFIEDTVEVAKYVGSAVIEGVHQAWNAFRKWIGWG
jgi:hypothetical protein